MDEAKFVEEMLAIISQNPQVLEAIRKMYELAVMRQKPEVVEELLEVVKSY